MPKEQGEHAFPQKSVSPQGPVSRRASKKSFIQISIQIPLTRPPLADQLIVGAAHTV